MEDGSDTNLSRRQFLQKAAQLGLSAGSLVLGLSCSSSQPGVTPSPEGSTTPVATPVSSPSPSTAPSPVITVKGVDIAVAKGDSPAAITKAAVETLGGIGRLVKRGDVVVVKPNICTSRKPQYAATTNPEVIETLVRMCLEAGAKTVKVFDGPFEGMNTAYEETGIQAAVSKAGGQLGKMSSLKYKKVDVPKGTSLKSVSIYDDMLNADVIINVPIAKDHELARLTLGMKNMMGIVQDRQFFHGSLGQRVADLSTVVRAHLTLIDAVRILTDHGPTGGNLSDVKQLNTVVASTDIVAADSFATSFFGLTGNDIDYIKRAGAMGLGEVDIRKLSIREVKV